MRVGDGTAGPGRPKGSQNKVTVTVKAAFAEAFERRGGTEALIRWAASSPQNETEFYRLSSKLIPTEMTGKDGADLIPPTDDTSTAAKIAAIMAAARAARDAGAKED